ncbi:MAG: zf-HC2 domain-containing protein [Candidatus Omnitrophota bacterium]
MKDNLSVACGDIRKKLKAFLDDLLAEDERQAFVAHLDGCGECKDYVRKIGSVSNQLWELGGVNAPSDLSSTILFRLKQAEQEIRKPRFVISKKLGIGILVVTLAIPLIFLLASRLKSRKQPQEADRTPVVEVYVERKSAVNDSEAESLFGKLKDAAAQLGVSEKAAEEATDLKEEAIKEAAGEITLIKEEAFVTGPKPLHWHFLYADKTKEQNLKKEKQVEELRLEKKTEESEQLDVEIERLEREKSRIDYESQSFGTIKKAGLEEQREALVLKIAEKVGKKEENSATINLLENNILEAERSLQQYKRDEAQCKADLINAVNSSGLILDYQTDNLFAFTAKGEKIESVLGKILLISPGSSSLRDYTPIVSVDPDQEYRVSVYLEKETTYVQHWHVTRASPVQRERVLDVIREESGRISYESEELIGFSISKGAIKKLKTRVLAMRIDLSEPGYTESEEGRLSSGPVEISIYFSER